MIIYAKHPLVETKFIVSPEDEKRGFVVYSTRWDWENSLNFNSYEKLVYKNVEDTRKDRDTVDEVYYKLPLSDCVLSTKFR